MGLWSAYFFAKLLLYAGGYIGFNAWLNLLFAAFTALPPKNARQRFTKNAVAVPVSIALLYHDSWLPPLNRALSQMQNLSSFTPAYLLELAMRFFNWMVIAELAAMFAIYALARRKLRLSTFVFIGIFAAMLIPRGGSLFEPRMVAAAQATGSTRVTEPVVDARNMKSDALETLLSSFYAKEHQRQVRFSLPASDNAPYDIVLLHVCSLSWDDLQAVQQPDSPLFKRFDILLTAFNSSASYSGPAAIRLLRGNCGQTAHKQLYDPPAKECLVMDGLQNAGFEPHWVMNHDGHFGDFFADVRDRGAVPVNAESVAGATVAQHSFDGSPIYRDYSILSRWWTERLANPAPRVALYYNTISLHDGNRVDGRSARNGSSFDARLADFTNDINRFLDELQKSGRHVIVVLIPEHGAAVRGDRKQIPGLREIPTPAITHVPVGVALINAAHSSAELAQHVDTPTSYLAVNELLSRFMADNPFGQPTLNLASYTQNLPITESIAENEGTVIMQVGKQYMMRTPDGTWSSWQ